MTLCMGLLKSLSYSRHYNRRVSMRNEATVATKSQVVQWLREGLVPSDLDDSVESLAGRTIGSLCGQKLMVKIEAGKYRLTNPQ